jgi:TMEM175 potassium channel family protein
MASEARMSTNAEQPTSATPNTSRLEALSDGVFAIAVTLLVLDLHVPLGKNAWGDLLYALRDLWPNYLAYLVSFAFILIMWINHHNLMKLIRRSDHNLLILNGLLLFCVTFVPFPTALLAAYITNPDAGRVAAVAYSLTYVLTAIAFNALWRYARHRGRLLNPKADPKAARQVDARYLLGPVIYLVCAAVGAFSPLASLGLNATLAIFFALPSRIHPVIRTTRRDEAAS